MVWCVHKSAQILTDWRHLQNPGNSGGAESPLPAIRLHTVRGSVPAARFASTLGGVASPLPDSPPHRQRGRCPSRVAKFLRESSLPVALHSAILIHARSSLPMAWLNPARKLLAGCIVFCDSDSRAKLLADGVAKSCAKPSKPISRNHCPTRHTCPTRPTSPSASREAQRPPGGAASPLPDSPPYGQRGRCPSRVAKSCAKAPCGWCG